MKAANFVFLSMIAIFLATGISCEGPTGPTGPRGERGAQGPRGEAGTANIVYSGWIDIEWSSESNTIKQMGIEEPLVTQRFVSEGGVVLMFLKIEVPVQGGGSADVIYPLPYVAGSWLLGFHVINGEGLGGLNFHINSLDNTPIPDNLWAGRQIRYLLIPGSVSLAAKGMDGYDYELLTKIFGIPD